MAKIILMMALVMAMAGCQKANHTSAINQEFTDKQNTNKIDTRHIIKDMPITFRKTDGNYPILIGDDYEVVNDNIEKFIQELIAFDKTFVGDDVQGVGHLYYKTLALDDSYFAFVISYNVQDVTQRAFNQYYQIDLKNKKQMLLSEYLKDNQIDVNRLNKSINAFFANCHNEILPQDNCDDGVYGYILGSFHQDYPFDIKDNDNFYRLDSKHIVLGIHSNKATSHLKINLNNFDVGFLSN